MGSSLQKVKPRRVRTSQVVGGYPRGIAGFWVEKHPRDPGISRVHLRDLKPTQTLTEGAPHD